MTRDKIDTTVPHPARRYDYWLGGKDNFAADRESGDAIAEEFPTVRLAVLENRNFMRRVVRHLVSERGIRQFLDIGTGIPTSPNLHEIAQTLAPDSRVVYVDNDPLVMVQRPCATDQRSPGRRGIHRG
jgi:S-adenosyl methyltransferase